MKIVPCAWALLLSLGLVGAAHAQTALDRLEDKLAEEEEEAPPAEDEAPALELDAGDQPGFLGAMLDGRETVGRGVKVMELLPDGPAEAAGLEVGDLVQAIDGERVREMEDVAALMRPLAPGTTVTFGVLRDGRQQSIRVRLGERPALAEQQPGDFGPDEAGEEQPRQRVQLGLAARTVNEEAADRLGLTEVAGALVTEVIVGSPADVAGIPLQAVIVEANGRPIVELSDLTAVLAEAAPGDELDIVYISQGRRGETTAVLEQAPLPADADAGLAPPQPLDPADASGSDAEGMARRIEELERQVDELLKRIEALENAQDEAA